MKNCLVTGADGFIGSHLAEVLVQQGYNVKALTFYNSFNNWGWLENSPLQNSMEILCGDIRDPFFCNKITKDVDTVFHLAALIAIPFSYVAPQSYVETNITGTLNMLKGSQANSVSRFIQTSTSEVYGTAKQVPINEEHPIQAQSPYSATKISSDAMAMSFYNAFELPVTIARPFNTYGPRQSARAVIPTIISQIAAGKRSIELGDLSPTRDFNYVSDTCAGFVELAKSEITIGEVFNIGSNHEISIGDTLNLIKRLMESDVKFTQDPQRIRPKNSEVHRLVCDNSKINKATGFAPAVNIEQGLQKTIEWFTDPTNLKFYKENIYNV